MSNIIDSFLKKNEIRKEVRKAIILSSPNILHKLDSTVYEEVLSYLNGYYKCFETLSKKPFNEYEVKELLLKEALVLINKKFNGEY